MKEKILTVLVVASLVLSVFNLVLMLRTNGINTITNITEPTTTPTAEVYAVNVTRTYYQITGYTYDFVIVNPTTKTVPCVISVTLSNGTVSQSYVLTYQEYQFYLQIFTIPPQSSIQYSNYAQFGGDPLHLDVNCTTSQITIFDLLNGAIGQQTLAIQQISHTTLTGQAGVILCEANVNFYSNGAKIDIDIGNSGTSDTTIIQVYIGTSSSAMDNQTIIPVPLQAGSVQRITVDYSWQYGVTYYFKVLTSTGQSLPWAEQAPVA